ncbi:MAG: hypothetical protein CMN77_08550 [Spirochaetaceae bacterium]|nr:hypothetical protein [Spirochaetaceae bacterium]
MSGVLSTFLDFLLSGWIAENLFRFPPAAPEKCQNFGPGPIPRILAGFLTLCIGSFLLPTCHQTVSEPYYLILDRAVKEYFLPDGDKSEGLRLLQEACYENDDSPDLLCYNAGVLLLRENRPGEALDYFEKARALHDIPLYRTAVRTTELQLDRMGDGDYTERADALIAACRKREKQAVDLIRQALEEESEVRLRQFASQPLMEECLRSVGSEQMDDLISRMEKVRQEMPDYQAQLREIELSQHPLNRLWNPFWKYGQNPGGFPAVEAWAATLDAARRGSASGAEGAARRFFSLPELRGSDQGVALRRAGALLILQDPFFDGVRSGGLKALAQSNL